jgi:beta-xylosidase
MGGYHLPYAVYQAECRQEMKAYLTTHSDAALGTRFSFIRTGSSIADPAFSWEEEGEEFLYNGALYDVVTIRHTADSVIIHAICDDKENQLEQQLAAVRAAGGLQHKNPHAIKAFPVFIAPTALQIQPQVILLQAKHIYSHTDCTDIKLALHTPPPRIV